MSLSRPLLIGLIASATLNVFLIGGVAGVAFVRLSSPAAPPPPLAPAPAPAPSGAAVVAPGARSSSPVAQEVAAPPAAQPSATPRPVAARSTTPPQLTPSQPATAPIALAPGERLARPPLWTAGDQLSPSNQAALRQTLKAANQKNRAITRQAREERRAALQVLSTPGADPAEVARRLGAARALDQEARANVEAALASFASTLSPQERSALAEGLRQVYAPANGDGDRGARRERQ